VLSTRSEFQTDPRPVFNSRAAGDAQVLRIIAVRNQFERVLAELCSAPWALFKRNRRGLPVIIQKADRPGTERSSDRCRPSSPFDSAWQPCQTTALSQTANTLACTSRKSAKSLDLTITIGVRDKPFPLAGCIQWMTTNSLILSAWFIFHPNANVSHFRGEVTMRMITLFIGKVGMQRTHITERR